MANHDKAFTRHNPLAMAFACVNKNTKASLLITTDSFSTLYPLNLSNVLIGNAWGLQNCLNFSCFNRY